MKNDKSISELQELFDCLNGVDIKLKEITDKISSHLTNVMIPSSFAPETVKELKKLEKEETELEDKYATTRKNLLLCKQSLREKLISLNHQEAQDFLDEIDDVCETQMSTYLQSIRATQNSSGDL